MQKFLETFNGGGRRSGRGGARPGGARNARPGTTRPGTARPATAAPRNARPPTIRERIIGAGRGLFGGAVGRGIGNRLRDARAGFSRGTRAR